MKRTIQSVASALAAACILTLVGCTSNDSTPTQAEGDPKNESSTAQTDGAVGSDPKGGGAPDGNPSEGGETMASKTAAEGSKLGTGGDPTKSGEVEDLVARLRRDKERQQITEAANQPAVPTPTEMEQQLSAMSRNFVERLAGGDAEQAKPCFLSDEEVDRLFSPAYSKLLASTRGSLNVAEWEKFQLSTAGGQEVQYVGCESVRPSVANPRERGLYRESVLFIDTLAIDYKVGDADRKIQLKHLVKLDGDWKFLQFELK